MSNTPFIIDNSDAKAQVGRYLSEWFSKAKAVDIATGYFEIGSLLALDGNWQRLRHIRILMGDEVSKRTEEAFTKGVALITAKLNDSVEAAKEENDFLDGVPAIVEALRTGQIEARVYRRVKFHAKAYITYTDDGLDPTALVGSSNFTLPGLHQNVELNVLLKDRVPELQEWFERHWEEAEPVTDKLLHVIEKHILLYTPFDVYARAMVAYFRNHEVSISEWERQHSKIYPILDQYQREGYHALMRIARRYNGALLCDGVGLGKTFIGLMVIERLLYERKRVALIVPKAARKDVWEAKLRQYLPEGYGLFSNLVVYNHTDLLRGGDFPEQIQQVADKVDAIVIDEAHHFRTISSDRARKLFEITEGKQMFLLTATPVNNSLYDLMHLIEYFSRRRPDYFSEAPLGVHSLRGHFRKLENDLTTMVTGVNRSGEAAPAIVDIQADIRKAEQVLQMSPLFQALVVQRSRAYVKRSLMQAGGRSITFPQREPPKVARYSLAAVYGPLLDKLERAFNKNKPLLSLAIYNPIAYLQKRPDDIDELDVGRQAQIVALIRTLLLKRFESSARSFEASCEDLLLKLLAWMFVHQQHTADRWRDQHTNLLNQIHDHRVERGLITLSDDELEEDIVPDELKELIEKLDPIKYRVGEIAIETLLDLDQLADFLSELAGLDSLQDDKLQTLIHLLQTDPIMSQHKVLIFTEYRDTARYIARQLSAVGIGPLAVVDSTSKDGISGAVRAFAPYYNDADSATLMAEGITETRVLIATDILAEGLNLQDATCVINYDLHWNPVRLMQRIGRVDRRFSPDVEARIAADHPDRAAVRGIVHLWNFLPPHELNRILSLYERVTHKTLRISKTFGIEGSKLLTPEDDYDALRDFNSAFEGTTTSTEEMQLAYQRLIAEYPTLAEEAETLPLRLFSGQNHPTEDSHALFFCYRLPAVDVTTGEWSEQASFTRWYLFNLDSGDVEDDAARIFNVIKCPPEQNRRTVYSRETLVDIRKRIEKHIKDEYLRRVQAPAGVRITLLAWMELN